MLVCAHNILITTRKTKREGREVAIVGVLANEGMVVEPWCVLYSFQIRKKMYLSDPDPQIRNITDPD